MRKQAKFKLSVLAVALACSATAWAGLGKINVRSNLGENLKADIEMTGIRAGELDNVRVGLADSATFQNLNVDYSAVLSSLRFSLSPSAAGALIRVKSTVPVNDPYLRFVLEAKTPSGRSVREYTVLLDPANYSASAAGQNIVQDVPSYADNNLASRYQGAPGAVPATPTALKARAGSTLRSLAAKVKPRGASISQTMAALAQGNPDAFVDGDIHQLKIGATLKVPSARKIKSLTSAQVASILGAAPAQPRAAESQAPAMPKQGGDVLKLVPGEGGAADSAKLSELQQQINAREQALKDAEARISALEQQLKAMQGGQAPASVKSASEPVAVASAPAARVASAPAAAVKHPEPAVKRKPVVASAPAPQKSMLDSIFDNLPLIGGGAAALGLLGALGALIVRRRKSAGLAADAGANGALGRSSVISANPSSIGAGHSFMSNFTQAAGAIDAAEVDPVAEAEVYIAYGRDMQAEDILKDALAKDPSRHEVRMKLMEIYAARPDTASFEKLAREMQAAFDGKGAMWAKAKAMGLAIDPENPLYQGEVESVEDLLPEAPVAEQGKPIDLDQELFGETAPVASPVEPEIAAAAPAMEEDPLAALFDTPADAAPAVEEAGADMLDFNIDDVVGENATPAEEPAKAEPAANLLDFDFNLDAEPAAQTQAEPAAAEEQGFESLYEGLAQPAADAQPAAPAENTVQAEGISVLDDPLSTKLDLAKVYLDMGDREGAREVLQDLLSEAQGPLKDEAQALLTQISS